MTSENYFLLTRREAWTAFDKTTFYSMAIQFILQRYAGKAVTRSWRHIHWSINSKKNMQVFCQHRRLRARGRRWRTTRAAARKRIAGAPVTQQLNCPQCGFHLGTLQALVSPAKSTSKTETETETEIDQADSPHGDSEIQIFRDPMQAWKFSWTNRIV